MDANPGPSGAPVVRICKKCVSYRLRPAIDLFDAVDLQSPGALAAQNKWDEEQRQRAKEEMQRFTSRQPFEYEPHHYAWCASHTAVELAERADQGDAAALEEVMANGSATMNPVTGSISALYVLCAWMNPEGSCERYESAR